MVEVVGIRFKSAGKIYYFDPGELELPVHTKVIVETARGLELGEVVLGLRKVSDEEVVLPLKRFYVSYTRGLEKAESNWAKRRKSQRDLPGENSGTSTPL